MELEEMKNTWEQLNKRVDKQESVTQQIIEKVTHQKFKSQLHKIGLSEYVGTIICYSGAAYLAVKFSSIEELSVQVFAGIAFFLLLLLPVISLQSLRALRKVDIASNTYLKTIQTYTEQKIKFQKLQKINVILSFVIMLVAIPVLAAIQGKDLSETPYFWTLFFPGFVVFYLLFSYWVLTCYNRIINTAEKMLMDINI